MECECGNTKDFRTWTESEYSDGSDEPNTSNYLQDVVYNECLKCGEIL